MGKQLILVALCLAVLLSQRDDWPTESRLERTAGYSTAVLLVEPSHEEAEVAVAAFAATLCERPGMRGHVVVLAGQGHLSSRLLGALGRLAEAEVHFVQDQREAEAFGVSDGLGLYVFDAWGRLQERDGRSGEATAMLSSFRLI